MRKDLCLLLALGISCMLLASGQENFSLDTPAFKNGETIPKAYGCSRLGRNKSPELNWTQVPTNAKSFVVVCSDLDAVEGFFAHWILYQIPAETEHLAEGIEKLETLPNGAMQGMNSFHRIGYDGPCPPPGSPHRYVFTVYALDSTLNLKSGATYSSLQEAMNGHVIASAEIMGIFQS